MTNKRWKVFKRKKWLTLQDLLRDGVRRICQMLYQKNHCNSKLAWSEHLDCRWHYRSQYQSFEHNGMEIIWPTKGGKSSRERSGAHFRTCWEMVSEEFAKCYTKRTTVTANSPDLNIWIVADETAYKDLARRTLDELRRQLNFAWKNVT